MIRGSQYCVSEIVHFSCPTILAAGPPASCNTHPSERGWDPQQLCASSAYRRYYPKSIRRSSRRPTLGRVASKRLQTNDSQNIANYGLSRVAGSRRWFGHLIFLCLCDSERLAMPSCSVPTEQLKLCQGSSSSFAPGWIAPPHDTRKCNLSTLPRHLPGCEPNPTYSVHGVTFYDHAGFQCIPGEPGSAFLKLPGL